MMIQVDVDLDSEAQEELDGVENDIFPRSSNRQMNSYIKRLQTFLTENKKFAKIYCGYHRTEDTEHLPQIRLKSTEKHFGVQVKMKLSL